MSSSKTLSMIGYYLYFIGMNGIFLSLLHYTVKYCDIELLKNRGLNLLKILLLVDTIQLLLNSIFHHAFSLTEIEAYGRPYFIVNPYWGQIFHRIIDYTCLLIIIIAFSIKVLRTQKVYKQKYIYILIIMCLTAFVETFFIFMQSPIDVSMVGFAIFGLLIFYFSIKYIPLGLLDKMLLQASTNISDGMLFFDDKKRAIWANEKGLNILGMTEIEGESVVAQKIRDTFIGVQNIPDEWSICQRTADGRCYEVSRYFSYDRNNVIDGSYICIRDITEEQNVYLMERFNATHDNLTGLYTKEYLFEQIRIKLKDLKRQYFMLFIDISNFKLINDIYGTHFGDKTLIELANFMKDIFKNTDAVYGRLNGDKFCAMIPIEEFGEDIWNNRLSDFKVTSGTLTRNITIHVGVYEIIDKSISVSFMVDRAHIALQSIKFDYTNHIAYYTDDMLKQAVWDQRLTQDLPEAIKNENLKPYLQPIADTEGNVVGAEALIRWEHPELGFLAPIKFIPVFENNGMIEVVDRYMWSKVVELLSRWKDNNMFISINISPKDFYFMDVKEVLHEMIKDNQVDPKRLRIEITETIMMTDQENRMKILESLQNEGFIVEMDDFGSGYSSLNLLRDMPVDILKIDMNFLRGSDKTKERAKLIINNVINMSNNLNIIALTEGVETDYQFEKLKKMGCKLFQGYYFSKPIPIDEFEYKYIRKEGKDNGKI